METIWQLEEASPGLGRFEGYTGKNVPYIGNTGYHSVFLVDSWKGTPRGLG